MTHPDLYFLSILRAVVEVALLALLGQGVVALLSGSRRSANPVYRLFAVVTRPAIRIARAMAPQLVLDRHLPFVTFLLLFWLWIFLAWAKHYLST
jgi:hypothetical protein